MAACSGCGAATTGSFCSSCGAPVAEADLAPILLDTTGPAAAPVSARIQKSSRGRNVVVAVAIAAAVVVGGVMLSQSPETPSPAAVDDGESTTETTAARTTLRDAQSTRASATTPPENDTLLGASTDWFVLVQSVNGPVRIDTNTGEVAAVGVRGSLLGEASGRLLIRRNNGVLLTIDAAKLGGELPLDVSQFSQGNTLGSRSWMMPGSRPGRAWLIANNTDIASEVAVSSGAILRTLVLDPTRWLPVSPDFVSPEAGGIYALQDDNSYGLALDGRIIAEAPGRILVERCSESMICGMQWLASDTFEDLPQFFLPPDREDGWFPSPLFGGQFLVHDDFGAFDSETGEQFWLTRTEREAGSDQRVSISPDGQVVATNLVGGQLRLRLTDGSGKAVVIDESFSRGFGAPPIFIPRSAG